MRIGLVALIATLPASSFASAPEGEVEAPRFASAGIARSTLASLPKLKAETNKRSFSQSFSGYNAEPRKHSRIAGAVDITAIKPASEPIIDMPEIDAVKKVLGGGVASYYGKKFAGRKTANGERFDPGQLTAAHRSLPFGSKVRVTSKRTGKSVIVRINDRGPFHRGRVIDLSRAAAQQIGLISSGHGPVSLELL